MVTRVDAYKQVEVKPMASMGYAMSGQEFSTGEHYISVDTYGDYRWRASDSTWEQNMTGATMPGIFPETSDPPEQSNGSFAVKYCPGNKLIGYRAWNGRIFKTTNGGNSWAETAWAAVPGVSTPGNTSTFTRMIQNKMAVHPTDANAAVIGTLHHGLWMTADGNTWTKQTTIPDPKMVQSGGAGGSELTFVARSGTEEPGTVVIYATASLMFAHSFGNGFYTKVGAGAWTAMAMPSQISLSYCISSMAYDTVTNELIVVARPWIGGRPTGSVSKVLKWNGTTWTQINAPTQGNGYHNVDIDPFTSTRWLVSWEDGRFVMSNDRGATWESIPNSGFTFNAPVAPTIAFAATGALYLAIASIYFSRATQNKIYMLYGIGVAYTMAASTPTTITWNDITPNIEQLVAENITAFSNGSYGLSSLDKNLHVIGLNELRKFPTVIYGNGLSPMNALSHGNKAHESADPANAGLICTAGQNAPLTNPNGGSSAICEGTNFFTSSAYIAKTVADATLGAVPGYGEYLRTIGTKAIWVPTNAAQPRYSANGLAGPFSNISLPHPSGPGGFIADWRGLNNSYFYVKTSITQSVINPNKVWIYIAPFDDGGTPIPGGLWMHSSGGGTTGWTLVLNGEIGGNGFFYSKIKRLEYLAEWKIQPRDWLYYCNGGGSVVGSTFGPARYSTDDGASWTDIPGAEEVRDLDTGRPAPGYTFPSLYVLGRVKSDGEATGKWGVHYSPDNGQSWMTITRTYPGDWADDINSIAFSKKRFMEGVLGFHGSGYKFICGAAEGSRRLRGAA